MQILPFVLLLMLHDTDSPGVKGVKALTLHADDIAQMAWFGMSKVAKQSDQSLSKQSSFFFCRLPLCVCVCVYVCMRAGS